MASRDFYPTEWDDTQTMDVLFSPFRENREVNSSSWDSKMKFWKDMISKYCLHNKIALIDSKTLPFCFERDGKIPVCLDTVIGDLLREGKLKKMEDFCSGLNSNWLSWSFGMLVKKPIGWAVGNFVMKPLSWTYTKMFGNGDSNQTGIQFVLINQIKDISEEILQKHSQSVKSEMTDCVVGYDQLKVDCREITNDETTYHLAIMFLCSNNKCKLTVTDNGEKVLTFARRNVQSPVQAKMLSESDMKIYRLKTTEKQLLDHLAQLSFEMEKTRKEAKLHLNRGEKLAAMKCLRRKKKTEEWKHSKEEALENIRHMISLIQQAETNKKIMEAYSSGVEAYKDVRQKYGLTTDMIDEVMDNVQEAYDIHSNLDGSMAQNPKADADISTEELEKELDELIAGEGVNLPSPPSGVPHQELVNAFCTMKLVDDPTEKGLVLPEAPTHNPVTPPKPVGFSDPHSYTPSKRTRDNPRAENVPLLG